VKSSIPLLRVFVTALAFALVCVSCVASRSVGSGQSLRQHDRRIPQSVAMDLREHDGVLALHAFSFGAAYTIDQSKLSFTARPYDDAQAAQVPLDVTLGPPIYVPPVGAGSPHEQRLEEYAMTATFHGPPGPPGMYDVALHAAPGFAKTESGTDLPFGVWNRPKETWHVAMWWPDTRNGDSSLREAQRRFAGRDVYGYGGILIACPNWFDTYPADTPIRVREIVRDVGQIEALWTGSTVSGVDEMAPHFFAVEPLRLLVEKPSAEQLSSGGSSGQSVERCPALVRADWQLVVTISTIAPPRLAPLTGLYPQFRAGMTKDEVAWRFGYPRSFADLATIRSAATWNYDGSPFNTFSVTFRNNRVSSFTSAREMP
jgi:hypothetical protein